MPTLTIDDLFTPLNKDEVLAAMLEIGTTLGLDVSAWQPGQPGRTIIVITAQKIADAMSIVSTMNKAGFLDYAAQVTPEGGPGWLDILALAVYRVTRVAATLAATTIVFTCVNATPGTFGVGELHATTASGKTYKNDVAVSIPANGTASCVFSADVSGADSSAGTGQINKLITPQIGVTISNAAPAVGADAETNAALVSRCVNKLASLSTEGPKGAYDYNARTINGENQVAVSSGPLVQPSNPATRTATVTDPATGFVTTYVASANGAYASPPNYVGDVAQSIVSISNAAGLINVQRTAHGYATGDNVQITGAPTNTGANGPWQITVVDVNNFTLNGSTFANAAGASGVVERFSDLDLIDRSIQANAVPDAVTSRTLSSIPTPITVAGNIVVTSPASNLSDAVLIANALAALARFGAAIPISGVGLASQVYAEGIRTALFNANAGTVNVTLSSPLVDTTVPTGGDAEFPTPSLTVTRV